MPSRCCLHGQEGRWNRPGVFFSPREAEKSRCQTHSSFHISSRSIPFLSLIFFFLSTFKSKSQKHSCDFEYGSLGHRLCLGEAWACLVLYLLWNNFQKARSFLHFYLLSSENSFLVFTDHKGKQSVWFPCLEFRPRSNLFFYLNKMAQTPACYCRKASTFLGSILLFCVKFKNSRTLLGWSSQSWLQWPRPGTSGQ